jgi:toxin ParE1/3/4
LKLRFTPFALAELDEILTYIGGQSPHGSKTVQRRLRDTFELIRRRPKIGRLTTNDRLRRIVATPYPYLVFYEIASDAVVVIAVRHAARIPSSMPDA